MSRPRTGQRATDDYCLDALFEFIEIKHGLGLPTTAQARQTPSPEAVRHTHTAPDPVGYRSAMWAGHQRVQQADSDAPRSAPGPSFQPARSSRGHSKAVKASKKPQPRPTLSVTEVLENWVLRHQGMQLLVASYAHQVHSCFYLLSVAIVNIICL
jgi:hypothetical protein